MEKDLHTRLLVQAEATEEQDARARRLDIAMQELVRLNLIEGGYNALSIYDPIQL